MRTSTSTLPTATAAAQASTSLKQHLVGQLRGTKIEDHKVIPTVTSGLNKREFVLKRERKQRFVTSWSLKPNVRFRNVQRTLHSLFTHKNGSFRKCYKYSF